MMNQKYIILDLDSTLANIDHRLHFIQGDKKDWDSFYGNIPNDVLNEEIAHLARLFWKDTINILIFTGRPERTREDTINWLSKHCIFFDQIFFRKDGDYRKDYIIKKEMLDYFNKEDILFAVDDRQQCVDMYRSEGITCLQCADGKY